MRGRSRFQCSALTVLVAVALVGLGLGGCNNSLTRCKSVRYGVCDPIFLVSIQITPADSSVAVGSAQQLKAIGKWGDGSTGDITTSVNWTSSDTAEATIDPSGLATALSLGRPKLTATSRDGSITSSTRLIIVGAGGKAVPQFAYVTNLGDDTLSIYTVNAATGQLRGNGYVQTGRNPDSICLDPSGRFAYVTNNITNDISAFVVDSTSGSLTPISGSPFATVSSPFTVIVEPSGTFVYGLTTNPLSASRHT
jgi:Lactonase, 7-bladed beta-propeller/Bacterial Ig-like domain (group 2)